MTVNDYLQWVHSTIGVMICCESYVIIAKCLISLKIVTCFKTHYFSPVVYLTLRETTEIQFFSTAARERGEGRIHSNRTSHHIYHEISDSTDDVTDSWVDSY